MLKLLETRKTRETKLEDIGSEEDRKTVAICFIIRIWGRENRFAKVDRQEEESETAIVLRLIFHRQGRRTKCEEWGLS